MLHTFYIVHWVYALPPLPPLLSGAQNFSIDATSLHRPSRPPFIQKGFKRNRSSSLPTLSAVPLPLPSSRTRDLRA